MVIADLVSTANEPAGRVYLSTAPFPGDVIRTAAGAEFLVLRRTFLDLGPDTGAENRLSLELKVKTP